MKGTEKQVKWAEEIKAAMFAQIEAMKRNRKHFDEMPGEKPDNNMYEFTNACIQAVEQSVTKLWERMDDAAVVIDRRSVLTPENVIKSARLWMRENV